jgi:hypothetical protein
MRQAALAARMVSVVLTAHWILSCAAERVHKVLELARGLAPEAGGRLGTDFWCFRTVLASSVACRAQVALYFLLVTEFLAWLVILSAFPGKEALGTGVQAAGFLRKASNLPPGAFIEVVKW